MKFDKQQASDQAHHFFIGEHIVLLLSFLIGPMWAATWLLLSAQIRELAQHDWNPTKLGPGSWLDMLFWALGSAAGVIIFENLS